METSGGGGVLNYLPRPSHAEVKRKEAWEEDGWTREAGRVEEKPPSGEKERYS
jgi:hypothetical protein